MFQASPIFALRLGLPNTGTRRALPRSIDITPLAQAAQVRWSRQWSITISFRALQFRHPFLQSRGRMVCRCSFCKERLSLNIYVIDFVHSMSPVSWKLLKYLHFTSYSALVLTNGFSVNLLNCLINRFLRNILWERLKYPRIIEFLLLTLYKFFTNQSLTFLNIKVFKYKKKTSFK